MSGLKASILAILLLTGSLAPLVQMMAQAPVAKPKAKIQKPPVPRPFTIERLLTGLQDVKNGELPEPALIKRLVKDGVAFSSLPENLDRLRKAGASNALIETVQKLAPAPPPAPPPVVRPKPKGELDITCAPAECEVSVGGGAVKATVDGKLRLPGIPEGEVSVAVTKHGFTASESRVRIVGEKTIPLRVELKATRAGLELWGEQLRNKAVDSLGGEPGLSATKEMFATGECIVWGQDGKPYPSSIQMLIRMPGKAFFRTRAGKGGTYDVDYFPVFQSKTSLPEQEARALDAGLRLVNDYQLAPLLDRMRRPVMTLIADGVVPAKLDGAVFHAESSTDKFTVSLDADGRPKEIEQTTAMGKGVRAQYSDYKLERGSYVPTRLMIVWPGTPRQGISIHFTSIELSPDKSKDALSVPKKRRRLW